VTKRSNRARRRGHDEDGRLVLVSLEPEGLEVIERLFPAFNMGEALVSASLTGREKNQLAALLRKIIRTVEEEDGGRDPVPGLGPGTGSRTASAGDRTAGSRAGWVPVAAPSWPGWGAGS
jgi:hypothetical protein